MKIPILAEMVWSRVNGPVPLAVTGRPSTMSIKVLLRRLVERQVERQGVNTIVAGGHNVEEPGDGQPPSIFSPTPQRKGNRTRGNSPPQAASMRMRRPGTFSWRCLTGFLSRHTGSSYPGAKGLAATAAQNGFRYIDDYLFIDCQGASKCPPLG